MPSIDLDNGNVIPISRGALRALLYSAHVKIELAGSLRELTAAELDAVAVIEQSFALRPDLLKA